MGDTEIVLWLDYSVGAAVLVAGLSWRRQRASLSMPGIAPGGGLFAGGVGCVACGALVWYRQMGAEPDPAAGRSIRFFDQPEGGIRRISGRRWASRARLD